MSAKQITKSRARATLGTCGAAHFIHDGFSDALYVFLPLWAQAFGLSLTQVGVLKALYSAAVSSLQLPAGFVAERWGERSVLTLGTIISGIGFLLLGLANGFNALIACLLFAGLGSAVQHPLSSSLVSKAYANGARRVALGTYNFTGDLGKVAVPALIAVGIAAIGWRGSAMAYGAVGVIAAVVIFLILRALDAGASPVRAPQSSVASTPGGWGIRHVRGFQLLSLIGVIDFSTRTGFLTFLPFLLIDKGARVEAIGFALALLFGGGAAGKLLCGIGAARIGIVRTAVFTELLTGAGILLILGLPLGATLAVLPIVGFALNGTSSVLYGTVAEFAVPERQSRAFGLFYTIGIGASALGPLIYGMISDLAGVTVTLMIVGLIAFTAVPLCQLLAVSINAVREQ